jgi:hypothetical protein
LINASALCRTRSSTRRWRLGQLLAEVERSEGGRGNSLTGLTGLLKRIGMTGPIGMIAQRIGTLPDDEFDKTLAWLCGLSRQAFGLRSPSRRRNRPYQCIWRAR